MYVIVYSFYHPFTLGIFNYLQSFANYFSYHHFFTLSIFPPISNLSNLYSFNIFLIHQHFKIFSTNLPFIFYPLQISYYFLPKTSLKLSNFQLNHNYLLIQQEFLVFIQWAVHSSILIF